MWGVLIITKIPGFSDSDADGATVLMVPLPDLQCHVSRRKAHARCRAASDVRIRHPISGGWTFGGSAPASRARPSLEMSHVEEVVVVSPPVLYILEGAESGGGLS